MDIVLIILIVASLVLAVWGISKWNGVKSKILAIFIISIILFSIFSFNMVFKGREISIQSVSDLKNIGQIYFSWLVSVFNNVKAITTQAVKMNWEGNKTT